MGKAVPENHKKTSEAGKLLLDWVKSEKYVIVNALECVTGGPFTRYDINDPDNENKKSLLDYVIVSADLVKYIDKLEIDNKLEWTPCKSVKGKLKFPDHYAILLRLKDVPILKKHHIPSNKETIWNTKKKDGWVNYRNKTENNEQLNRVPNEHAKGPDFVLNLIEKELNRVKYSCFGKIKISSKTKDMKRLEMLQKKKINKEIDGD